MQTDATLPWPKACYSDQATCVGGTMRYGSNPHNTIGRSNNGCTAFTILPPLPQSDLISAFGSCGDLARTDLFLGDLWLGANCALERILLRRFVVGGELCRAKFAGAKQTGQNGGAPSSTSLIADTSSFNRKSYNSAVIALPEYLRQKIPIRVFGDEAGAAVGSA